MTAAMTRLSREHSSEHDAIALGLIRAAGPRGASAAGIGSAITRPKRLSMRDTEAIGLASACSLMRQGLVTVTGNNWFVDARLSRAQSRAARAHN
jgi:hypothetical protein